MKSIRFFKIGVLTLLLLSFVFLFTSCDNSSATDTTVTDAEFSKAIDFKTLTNYEITINSTSPWITNETYIITRNNDKFMYVDKTDSSTTKEYFVRNGSENFDYYYSSDDGKNYTKQNLPGDLFDADNVEFVSIFNLLFSSTSEASHTYDETSKCYNVEVTNQVYDMFNVSGTASFYFENKQLVKLAFSGDLSIGNQQSRANTDPSFTMNGTVLYNIPDFDLPQVS